jgi:hypothetical protein
MSLIVFFLAGASFNISSKAMVSTPSDSDASLLSSTSSHIFTLAELHKASDLASFFGSTFLGENHFLDSGDAGLSCSEVNPSSIFVYWFRLSLKGLKMVDSIF